MNHEERIDSAVDALEASRVDNDTTAEDVAQLIFNLRYYLDYLHDEVERCADQEELATAEMERAERGVL